jgi:hypothetical protein
VATDAVNMDNGKALPWQSCQIAFSEIYEVGIGAEETRVVLTFLKL